MEALGILTLLPGVRPVEVFAALDWPLNLYHEQTNKQNDKRIAQRSLFVCSRFVV
jgi:hypothetical protein